MDLSIACVTQAADYAKPFLLGMLDMAESLKAEIVFGAHGYQAVEYFHNLEGRPFGMTTVQGEFLEQMLDPVLHMCHGHYILRLDDDERCTPEMVEWLRSRAYHEHPSWFFPRYHLWPDDQHVITSGPCFPDFQGRLTIKEQAHRPPTLHAGQPYPAWRAPVPFEHHAFLAKSYAERQTLTAKYETIKTGVYFPPERVNIVFPEDVRDQVKTEPYTSDLMARTMSVMWWRQAGLPIPPAIEREYVDWTDQSLKVIRPRGM